MKFTVERQSLVNMIGLLAIKPAHRKQSDSWMRLTASGSRVFVEGNETTCGVEALVMSEGACRVRRSVLLRILQSYHPRVIHHDGGATRGAATGEQYDRHQRLQSGGGGAGEL